MPQELVAITVKPRSTRAGVELTPEGGVVVRVHAPAVEGAANREVLATLAAAVGVPKSSIHIVRGDKGRSKQVTVDSLDAAAVRARLQQSASGKGAAHA